MKTLPIKIFKASLLVVIISLVFACQENAKKEVKQKENSSLDTKEIPLNSTANTFFDKEVFQNLFKLKERFDKELSKGISDRPLSYIYEQHALRIRLDILNEEPYVHIYPYNERSSLSDQKKIIDQITFLTDKCGFLNEKTGEKINYYCFSIEEGGYFDYLSKINPPNELIDSFREGYLKEKSINPNIRNLVLMQALDVLDFENIDHQIFYFLFHLSIQEERLGIARFKKSLQ